MIQREPFDMLQGCATCDPAGKPRLDFVRCQFSSKTANAYFTEIMNQQFLA